MIVLTRAPTSVGLAGGDRVPSSRACATPIQILGGESSTVSTKWEPWPVKGGKQGVHHIIDETGGTGTAVAEAFGGSSRLVMTVSGASVAVPAGWQRAAGLRMAETDPAFRPVQDLLSQEDDYDDEFGRPTEYAVRTAMRLLRQVSSLRRGNLPRISASTLGDGGLRIHFHHETRRLRLAIPADTSDSGYVYHRDGDEYATEEGLAPHSILKWLTWLAAE